MTGLVEPAYRRLAELTRSAAKSPLPALTLIGIALFSIRWLTYSFFYGGLDASPEDVGLGFSEALAQSAIAVTGWTVAAATVFLFAAVAAVVLVVVGVIAYIVINQAFGLILYGPAVIGLELALRSVGQLVRLLAGQKPPSIWSRMSVPSRFLKQLRQLKEALPSFLRWLKRVTDELPPLGHILAVWAVFVAIAVQLSLPVFALVRANRVQHGHGAPRPKVLGVPVLDLRAERAYVFWNSGKTPEPVQPSGAQACMMFLGSANSQTVLYDKTLKATIRVPSSSVTVAIIRGKRQQCPPG